MTDLLDVHPFADEVVTDRYRWYAQLRERSPVVHLRNPDLWVVTGYDEVVSVLRNPDPFSSEQGYAALGSGYLRRATAPTTCSVSTCGSCAG